MLTTRRQVGDTKVWVSIQIIQRKYMTMSEEFAPQAKQNQAATPRIASHQEK